MSLGSVGRDPAYVTAAASYTDVAAAAASDDTRTHLLNRMSWGAVLAGVAAALVTQLVLSLLGVGIGLASFQVTGDTAANPSAGALSVNAGLWWVGSGLIASLVGGIAAGRLSGAARHSTAGWHGFITWCATTLVVVYLLGTALGGVLGGAFSAISSTIGGAGHAIASVAGGAARTGDPTGLQAKVRSLVNPNDAQSTQDAVTTYLRATIDGDQKAADAARDQAVNSLAHTANISTDEARNRINQVQQQVQQAAQRAKEQAAQAAEATRKAATEGSLFAVAALLFGAIFGIVGGGLGTPRRAGQPIGTGLANR